MRTLVDLADVLRADDLARTVSAAERADLADRATLPKLPGRRDPVREPHVWTRSGFERRFRRITEKRFAQRPQDVRRTLDRLVGGESGEARD